MKPLLILTIAILLAPVLASAQSNYKPGYVVNLKGDTLRGFIDYQAWDTNPDAINFKKTLTDRSSKYGADDIDYFSVDKLESYKRYTVHISTDQTNPNKVVNYRDTSNRVATVFLKVLEKGNRLALYSFNDEIKMRFYIGDSPDYTPKELIFRVFTDPTFDSSIGISKGATTNEYTYRKQLSALAQKYGELNDNLLPYIAKSEYNIDDLLSIVSKINHATETELEKTKFNGPSLNFFAGAGVNLNTTSPSTVSPYYTAGGRSYTSYLPAVFLGMNLFANPANRKLQFRLELSEAQSEYKYLYASKVSPYEPTEASYNEMALAASVQLIYNFYNTDNFKIFGGVGFTLMHCSFSNSYLGSQSHDGSESDIEANNPYFFFTSNDGFVIKGGVQFTKHFEFFANYLNGISTTNGGYFQLTSNIVQLGVNYIF